MVRGGVGGGKTTAALTITSPNKETTAKLFGGQYTALAATATTSTVTQQSPSPTFSAPAAATVNTKEEITKDTTMEEEYLEKSKKTKEYQQTVTSTAATTTSSRTIKTLLGEEDEEVPNNITTSGIKHHQLQQQQQQMATRLTGSSSYSSSSSTTTNTTSSPLNKRGELASAERELSGEQQCYSITGANNGSANQSSSKCESERLVCAANNSGSLVTPQTTTTTPTIVKISQKLQENQFIKNEQQHKTKIIKTIKTNNTSVSSSNITNTDLKSPTKTASTSSPSSSTTSSSSPFAATNNCAITKKKMVAMQEMKKSTQNSATQHLHPINSTCSANSNNNTSSATNGGVRNRVVTSTQNSNNDLDSNEDLSYGPGIVSKLRCRYLSLALRESMEQQRLNKDLLRRSTSLNNLLDDDHAEDDEEDDEENDENLANIGVHDDDAVEQQHNISDFSQKKGGGILKNSCSSQEKRFSQGSNGVGVTFTETSFNKRSRHLKRGNDSLKRARSVEALLSEKSPWHGNRISASSITPTCVTIEDKIQNARERLHQGTDHMPPRRLTSIIDDTERPPPDLVKQTLKMFEASANRRPRCTNRSNSKGDVASKVETFKNIIKDQKPVVTYPKPVSPTKKLNSPNLAVKPNLKSSNDLLQTPLGRKTMAVANSHSSSSTNTLSEHTPDIIPRQKLHAERELNKEKFTGIGINKEKFMSSNLEPSLLSTTNVAVDSPLKSSAKEKFMSSVVDSPVTSLSKELERLKLNDNSSTPLTNRDNFANDNLARNGGSVSGSSGGGVDNNSCSGGGDVDDAFHSNDQYTAEEMNTNEFSSLKSENDKIKQQQINNEIQSNSNATAGAAISTGEAAATTAKARSAHSSSDLSDGEDDDEYGISTTKRITRTALDNIAKAGTTQQFKFSSTTHSTTSPHAPSTSTTTSVAGKQIGVIRPLLNTSQQQQQTTTTTTSASNNITQKVAATTDSNMETLKHSSSATSLTSREIEKNRINDLKKSSSTTNSSNMSPSSSPSASLDNVIKSSTTGNSSSTSSNTSSASGYSEVDTVISATNSPLWAMRKRRQNPPAPPAEQTSMVFNFSNRKEVPDYIESDGVIFRPKRQLPKVSLNYILNLLYIGVDITTPPPTLKRLALFVGMSNLAKLFVLKLATY